MAHRVAWSSRAISDVDAIASYISADSPTYASAVVRRIMALAGTLSKFPLSGRRVPEYDDENIREVIAYSYRIIYAVTSDSVLIAAVIHGKRMI